MLKNLTSLQVLYIQRAANQVDFNQPIETLAKWWNQFNWCDWPPDLSELKPRDFTQVMKDRRYKLIKPMLEELEKRTTVKDRLAWHHIHNLGRTPEQFEKWWTNSGPERTNLAYKELATRRS